MLLLKTPDWVWYLRVCLFSLKFFEHDISWDREEPVSLIKQEAPGLQRWC